jgi:hypothetical protein
MNIMNSVRNRDLQPLLCIFLEPVFPLSLIDMISEYAKSKEEMKLYLFLQVKGNARFERVYLTAAETKGECGKYFDVLRNKFHLSSDDEDDYPEDTHDSIISRVPNNHYDDSNLLHMYKLKINSGGKCKLSLKSSAFIRGSNC